MEQLEARVLFAFAPADPPIAPVMDAAGNSYVLGTDGLRLAVARYKPSGELDTGWAIQGVDTMQFRSENTQDVPAAIVISRYGTLFVAGNSGGEWAIGRLEPTVAGHGQHWQAHYLPGTVKALWLDTSENDMRLGVAGTDPAGNIQVAVLYPYDVVRERPFHNGGSFDTSFGGGTGYAVAPASIYKLPPGSYKNVSVTGLAERDDLPSARPGEGENEWLVSGTVTYSPGNSNKDRSRAVVVDFRPDGSSIAQFDRGRGEATTDPFGCRALAAGENSAQMTGRARVRGNYLLGLLDTE